MKYNNNGSKSKKSKKTYSESHAYERSDRKPRYEKPEPSPVAILLRDTISDQMMEFLRADTNKRFELSESLFKIDMFPCGLSGCEGAEKYNVFQMERSTRMRKDRPEELPRMSTALVLINKETQKPEYYLTATITSKETASLQIYYMNDNGQDYRRTVRWNSHDYGF